MTSPDDTTRRSEVTPPDATHPDDGPRHGDDAPPQHREDGPRHRDEPDTPVATGEADADAEGRASRRRRLPDPWGVVAAVAALGVFLVHGFQGALSRDLGVYGYGGQQMAEGVAPYESLMSRTGPLAEAVPGLGVIGARLVGIDDVLGMRLLMMGLSILTVWLIYVLGRDLFSSRLAGLLAAASLLAFQGFVIHATGGPREKTTMVLFLVCALWACSRRHWLLAGGAVALGTLAWQPVFFIATPAVLVCIAAVRGWAVLRALLFYALGGTIVTAATVLAFWLAGALQEFLDGFFLINYKYTADSAQSGLMRFLDYGIEQLFNGFGWSLWLVLAGLVLAILAALVRLPTIFRGDAAGATVVAVGIAVVTSALWSLASFNGWADLTVGLPLAALGLGALAGLLRHRLPGAWGARVVAVWCVVTLVAAVTGSITSSDDALAEQRHHIRSIMAKGPSDATIMSFGAPHVLVLTGRTNPAPYQSFAAGLRQYVEDTYPGGFEAFVDLVEDEQATYLVFDNPDAYPWLEPLLESDYAKVGKLSGSVWYVNRDVGPETIKRLQEERRRLKGGTGSTSAATVK